MANPTNKGVGTGTAVVADYGVLNTVTDKFFKGLDDNAANKKLAKDRANLIQKKAIDHLSGKLGEYDSSKVLYQDQIPLYELHQKNRNYWNGEKMAEAMKDPAVMKQYMDTIADEKRQIANSVNSVKPFEEFYKSMNSPESGFSTDKKAKVASYLASAGATMAGAKELGYLARDQVIGSINTKMEAAFSNKGEVLYKTSQGSRVNNLRQIVKYDIETWLDDAEAIPKFKATITPEIMQDMDIMYPGMSYDEQVVEFYNKFKESRETKKSKIDIGRAPANTGDGDKKEVRGEGNSKYRYAFTDIPFNSNVEDARAQLRKDIAKIKSEDEPSEDRTKRIEAAKEASRDKQAAGFPTKVITMKKLSAGAATPFAIDGAFGVISEIRYNKNKKWEVVRTLTKDNVNEGDFELSGTKIVSEITPTIMSHLESAHNITDLDDFYDTNFNKRNKKQTKANIR